MVTLYVIHTMSNIIVCLLVEAKSQAQPEHGSCERSRGAVPWSTSQALA